MPCPICGSPSEVIETRDKKAKGTFPAHVRRRRVCLKKRAHRFTTVEMFATLKGATARNKGVLDQFEQKRRLSFGKAIADTLRRMAYHTEKNGLMDYCDSRGPNRKSP